MINTDIYYRNCVLCPHRCGADRTAGSKGICGMTADIRAARAALHFWEEPCISGKSGSGAVFFSGCSLGCIFCQNRKISACLSGKIISTERLAEIFLELQAEGANNINLVTPDHFAPSIANAIEISQTAGLKLPVICNCSGYMSETAFSLLEPYVDVWLPDFKYFSSDLSGKYSRVPDYFDVAKRALEKMFRAAGDPIFDESGMIRKGVIVRHLVLPGHTSDSKKVIQYLHETYGDHIYISIMSQYTPMAGIDKAGFPELARPLTKREYDKITDYAIDIGVENGFIQEGPVAFESFIPEFDFEGL